MTRRDRRRQRALARGKHRISAPQATAQRRLSPAFANRRALLLGTALASTMLVGGLIAPAPASAAFDCITGPPPAPASPDPISVDATDSIICVNTEPRDGAGAAISLRTVGDTFDIYLNNSGRLTAGYYGIFTRTYGDGSGIEIVNSGDIVVSSGSDHFGIFARTGTLLTPQPNSPIEITNSGDLEVTTAIGGAFGILGRTYGTQSSVDIVNTGDLTVTTTDATYGARGISAYVSRANSSIDISNSGDIEADGIDRTFGIRARVFEAGNDNPITIVNRGELGVTSESEGAIGIYAYSSDTTYSPISITNGGSITLQGEFARGIWAISNYESSPVSVTNSGNIDASADDTKGIYVRTTGPDSSVSITNSGDIVSTIASQYNAYAIDARAFDAGSAVNVVNNGDLTVTALPDGRAQGIATLGRATVRNSGHMMIVGDLAYGFRSVSINVSSPIEIWNSGNVTATGGPVAYGIRARTTQAGSPITIINTGSIFAEGDPNGIVAGILTDSVSRSTIVNSGEIGASSGLAIYGRSGTVDIFNTGTITGYVLLDANDKFINQAGGVFEARQTSDFDYSGTGGTDLFRNETGATVRATGATRFVNLERFENQGLISMVDGTTGDSFTISNTVGGTDLDFVASGNSTLAVDAFLGGPGNSASDTFTVEGDVSGVTRVQVVDANGGPGVFNPSGIRVVTATGATPNPDAFQLAEPIDTGFFDYDLFFTPTGSGFWELRSFPGGGAYLLPQLVTTAQDIWHQSSSTWFDRTADLRVLLAGGAAPTAYDPDGNSLSAAGPYPLTPAVWARASGSWLDRDGTARNTAYGRGYTFDLDRDLDTIDFQVGVDMGKRDVLSKGDALVFGLLGGFVHGDLNYDSLARNFDFDGGQVGAYATYLNGGLFVDTLLNAHLYSLETEILGFPSSLDANTIGLRTDTGYRFGSFSGGPFIEPLATLEVMWADIDGFSLGGNTVSFDDDANVRGRLGLRAGTTTEAWEGTLMEPFVTGSLWGNLTDDNSATLVSTGRTFRFQDQLDDVWGEVSAGVNFFNFSQTTAVFAKVDVTFGDDLTGVGGKAGMRVNW